MSKLLLFLSGGFFFTAIILQSIDVARDPIHPWFLMWVPAVILAVISEAIF